MKFTLILSLFFAISLSAQETSEVILTKTEFEEKARFHVDKSFEASDVDSTYFHASQSLYYAEKSNNEELIMEANHAIGLHYKIIYDYDSSKKYMVKSREIAYKIDDEYFKILTNSLLGVIKASEKQYQLSTNYYNEALILAKEAKDTINVALLFQNIALNYYFIDEFELAKMYMFKALDEYNSINVFYDDLQKDTDYIYLYMKLSLVVDAKEDAINYTDLSIKRSLQSKLPNYAALGHLYKGRVYSKYSDYNLAVKNYQKTLQYNRKANVKASEPYMELMNVFVKMNQNEKAKAYMDTLYSTFPEKSIRPLYIDKNKLTSEVYRNIGDIDNALYYAEKRAVISDSLLKNQNNDLMIEYGKKFETTEKENEIRQQQKIIEKQKNENSNLLLYGFSSLFGVLFLYQWRYYTQRNRKRKIEVAYEKEHEFNQVRTSFLENISHEIRTPLTLINGYLNLIEEETNDNPKIKRYIDNALVNSKKVIFDADEILSLLKFEDHKISLKIVSKNLNEFLRSTFCSFDVLANTRIIELIYKSKIPNNCLVELDFGKIETILTNLISNAIKFSNSNSKVIFTAEILNHNLIIEVIDFGHGIDKEDQKRIFSRFYQSKNNKSIGGIGIGLLLAKDFAQFLNGDLIVKSDVGKGSKFQLKIPLSKNISIENCEEEFSIKYNNTELIEVKEEITENIFDKNKPSILIVEDSIEMSNYLKEILSPYYNCTFAFNGLEGIDEAKKQVFDLVASDVMMPKVDGYEFKKLLKTVSEYATIPFILITAKTLPEDKIKGFSIGIDDYIIKPFNKEELIVRINNLLKNSSEIKLSIASSNKSHKDKIETHVDKLLKKIEKVVLKNLSNENFKVDDLAKEMNYSQRQLSRILNEQTGLTTIKFILEIKLKEAYKLLEQQKFKTISEVQFEVGITSSSYFSEKFKNRFGINPSELVRKQIN